MWGWRGRAGDLDRWCGLEGGGGYWGGIDVDGYGDLRFGAQGMELEWGRIGIQSPESSEVK